MKITACCITYKRPRQLGEMIECFCRQDYPDRELVILDDAGQYNNQSGDRWRLVSTFERYPSLGSKRNACMALAGDTDALAVWDDDDLYLPWALSATVAALQKAPWSRPSVVLHLSEDGTRLDPHETFSRDPETGHPVARSCLFHGQWAFRRRTFFDMGGYGVDQNNGEDQELAGRLIEAGVPEADPIALGFRPFYIYPWAGPSPHLSGMGPRGYHKMARQPGGRIDHLDVRWSREWDQLPIGETVQPRKF
jgi:glycosyltransferase involved in cell wall biosynthesis